MIRNGFLPPPVSLTQTSHGLIGSSQDSIQHFPSLFVLNSLQIDQILQKKAYKTIPYDLYCPSLKDVLKERVCSTCGLYFASAVMLRDHKKIHKNISELHKTGKKIRPDKVVTKRQKECMVVIVHGEDKDCEWIDEEELDANSDSNILSEASTDADICPIIGTEHHLQNPWSEIESDF